MLRKILVFMVLLAATCAAGQTCANWDYNPASYPFTYEGTVGHSTYFHDGIASMTGSCQYDSIGEANCATYCAASSNSLSSVDLGTVSNPLYFHKTTIGQSGGIANSNGGGASCATTVAAAANSCLIVLGCSVSVSFSATGSGIGTSVNFSSTDLGFTPALTDQTNCAAKADPNYGGGGGCGPCGCNSSPIIIDTNGEGFQLTSAPDGVRFDIQGNGIPVNIAWTARGSRNGFLALDRNGNGTIDSGKELFGNFTLQVQSADPNGYLALAEFDKAENGGNGDGVIDKRDAVYERLLLWIDENHDGISQSNELRHLADLGVYSLSLKYLDSPYTDAFGNQFRYKGRVNPLGEPTKDQVDRTSYDVFLEVERTANSPGTIEPVVCSFVPPS
jgi:hypothetical protein